MKTKQQLIFKDFKRKLKRGDNPTLESFTQKYGKLPDEIAEKLIDYKLNYMEKKSQKFIPTLGKKEKTVNIQIKKGDLDFTIIEEIEDDI